MKPIYKHNPSVPKRTLRRARRAVQAVMKKRISTSNATTLVKATYLFPNGMVATFGYDDEQIPELQGKYSKELEQKIEARSNANTDWNGFGSKDFERFIQ